MKNKNSQLQIFVTRHGQTNYNVEGRIQGRLNSILTKEGKCEAAKVVSSLRSTFNIRNGVIYSSPLFRTTETAKIFSDITNFPIKVRLELEELGRGKLEGKLKRELSVADQDILREFKSNPWEYHGNEMENFNQLKNRVECFLNFVKTQKSDPTPIIITHGYVIRMIAHVFSRGSMAIENIRAPHNRVYILKFENGQPTVSHRDF